MKIDKNVPYPTKSRSKNAKYPFHQMEIGDSFFLDGINRISMAAYQWSLHHPSKFTITKENNGYRCWRIK